MLGLTIRFRVNAFPRCTGPGRISAYTPLITVIGADALIPTNSRNSKRSGQLGARAQPRLKIMKVMKVEVTMILLPYASLSGLKTEGPKMYPMRNMETGRASWYLLVTLNELPMYVAAPLGKEELSVLLVTMKMPATMTKPFRVCFLLVGPL